MKINFKSPLSKDEVVIKLFLSFILAIGLVGSYLLDPEKKSFLTCFFHNKTGLSCPTCGLSRSFYSLSHLDLFNSFQFHLMGPILFFALFLLLLKWTFEIIFKREIKINIKPKLKKYTIFLFMFIWFTFFIIRITNELNFV